MYSKPLFVKVTDVREETDRIRSYSLKALDEGKLPSFTAGAHIGIVMPGRITRYYSLCGDPANRQEYTIAVQREDLGRGGSMLVHKKLSVGRMLRIHPPRNLFPLASEGHHTLVAGGIGITPMLSMAAEIRRRGQTFDMIVCVRNKSSLPFSGYLHKLADTNHVKIFYTDESMPNIAAMFSEVQERRHIYTCGPQKFMELVADSTKHWPKSQVHFESFSPVTALEGDVAFVVEAEASGKTFNVAADQSILQALRENGIEVDSVCENGTCGTCKVKYLEGQPEHRDIVLSEEQRKDCIMVCVSRSKQFLKLDL